MLLCVRLIKIYDRLTGSIKFKIFTWELLTNVCLMVKWSEIGWASHQIIPSAGLVPPFSNVFFYLVKATDFDRHLNGALIFPQTLCATRMIFILIHTRKRWNPNCINHLKICLHTEIQLTAAKNQTRPTRTKNK